MWIKGIELNNPDGALVVEYCSSMMTRKKSTNQEGGGYITALQMLHTFETPQKQARRGMVFWAENL